MAAGWLDRTSSGEVEIVVANVYVSRLSECA